MRRPGSSAKPHHGAGYGRRHQGSFTRSQYPGIDDVTGRNYGCCWSFPYNRRTYGRLYDPFLHDRLSHPDHVSGESDHRSFCPAQGGAQSHRHRDGPHGGLCRQKQTVPGSDPGLLVRGHLHGDQTAQSHQHHRSFRDRAGRAFHRQSDQHPRFHRLYVRRRQQGAAAARRRAGLCLGHRRVQLGHAAAAGH
ncbi:MAG: hypothetical protein BWY83_02344 [bacterium ADurb.Bin478]|nr:MAG: hypothetical protein BWY83_02344 [bacterium ADurb.Bin478]